MAGLEAAIALAAQDSDLRITVIESGDATDLRHINSYLSSDDALRLWLDPLTDTTFWRPWVPTNGAHFGLTAGLRRRLGGRSLYWHGVTLPIEDWALSSWPSSVREQLSSSWLGGPSLYSRVLASLIADQTAGGSITIAGRKFSQTPRAITASDASHWSAYSPVAKLGEAPNISIEAGQTALSLSHAKGQVIGVNCVRSDGTPARWTAGAIVLAAGTMENARLALPVLYETGALAQPKLEGLADHLSRGWVAEVNCNDASPEIAELAATGRIHHWTGSKELPFNLFANVSEKPGSFVVEVWSLAEQDHTHGSLVEWDPSVPASRSLSVTGRLSDRDRQIVADQATALSEVSVSLGLSEDALVFPSFDTQTVMLEDAMYAAMNNSLPLEVPLAWSSPLGSEYHEGALLRIGRDLDEQMRLNGFSNVYVLGPAAFARLGAANPSLTTLALSRMFADAFGRTQ